jgi:hypothetical protein
MNNSLWLRLSVVAALLAVAGNVVALSTPKIYAGLTPVFLPQALAQDIANLAVVAPLWLISARLALRGSLKAYLVWLGVLTFTVYNYFIYTFSVPFGPLFLLWVCVLGLSLYCLIGGLATVDHEMVNASFSGGRATTVTGWFLVVTAAAFTALWLSEDVPALLSGTMPKSVIETALPTNPVHVLDLAFFLPAGLASGIVLLKQHRLGYSFAPPFLVFLILTGIPILLTPLVQAARGKAAAWEVWIPLGTITAVSIALLWWLLSAMRTQVLYDREGN